MIEWNLDTGCPRAVGFGVPHDFGETVYNNGDGWFCKWGVMRVRPKDHHWGTRWPVIGWRYRCTCVRSCTRCHANVPIPVRECQWWLVRPDRYTPHTEGLRR